MNTLTHCCNLNIHDDLPQAVLAKIDGLYSKSPGWLGYGDGVNGEAGIPYWYSFDSSQKQITASAEPSGLQLVSLNISETEWADWVSDFKKTATAHLGFKVGELEEGEVSHEIEWL